MADYRQVLTLAACIFSYKQKNRKMKRLLFLAILASSLGSAAQYQWDYGLKLGAANYLGDIGGKELERRDFVVDMHLRQTRWAVGGYGRYKFSKRFALAANLDYLRIQDADRLTTYAPRRTRNLNFRNDMFELGVRGELTVWYDNDVGNRGFYNPDFKLYLFGGLAAYYSNPKARLVYDGTNLDNPGDLVPGDYADNTWYALRNLRTEGASYSAFGLAIPLGIGFYFTHNKEWRFGWEFSWRTTFSDYLDDVSTYYYEPNPKNPDDMALAMDLQSQTYPDLVAFNYGLTDPNQIEGMMNNFQHQPSNLPDNQSSRGIHSGDEPRIRNDHYLTTQFTIGKVIRGRSKFYKSKYSWVKNRASVRRSRAKF